MRGLPRLAACGGHSSSRCVGLSVSRPLLLRSTGSRRTDSAVVAHGPSCSAACGILPDQGSNPCPLHWQADSQPLRHQGSPWSTFWCRNYCSGGGSQSLAGMSQGDALWSPLFLQSISGKSLQRSTRSGRDEDSAPNTQKQQVNPQGLFQLKLGQGLHCPICACFLH